MCQTLIFSWNKWQAVTDAPNAILYETILGHSYCKGPKGLKINRNNIFESHLKVSLNVFCKGIMVESYRNTAQL